MHHRQENSLISLAGHSLAQSRNVNWAAISTQLATFGIKKTKEQCSMHFITYLRPRLLTPSSDEQWNAANVDALLYMEGHKAFVRTRCSLLAQGARDFPDEYVMQHMDWISLGEAVHMSAYQVTDGGCMNCILFANMHSHVHLLCLAVGGRGVTGRGSILLFDTFVLLLLMMCFVFLIPFGS